MIDFIFISIEPVDTTGFKFDGTRIRYIMGAFIFFSFGLFFNYRVKSEIKKICPRGKNHLLGGKRKRNIRTFHEDFKNIMMFTVVTIVDELTIHLLQIYEETLGRLLHSK